MEPCRSWFSSLCSIAFEGNLCRVKKNLASFGSIICSLYLHISSTEHFIPAGISSFSPTFDISIYISSSLIILPKSRENIAFLLRNVDNDC